MHAQEHVRFTLLPSRKRSTPRVMSVLRFGHAIAGKLWWPDCDARSRKCAFSLWPGQCRTALDGLRPLHAHGHVRFALWHGQGWPALGCPIATRTPGACSFSALHWPRDASFGVPSMTCAQGHVRFALLPGQRRPVLDGPRATQNQGHVRFGLAKAGQCLVA